MEPRIKVSFISQNYNEFKNNVRWHDYLSLIINEFSLINIRRYDWLDDRGSTYHVQLFGITVSIFIDGEW